jgi:hypothetical protein
MRKFIFWLGIIFIIEGIWTLLGGKILIRTEGGFVSPSFEFSILSIIIGVILILISRKIKENVKKTLFYSICPKCEETFNYVDLKDGMCPYCEDVKTEDLDGYYDRKKEDEK